MLEQRFDGGELAGARGGHEDGLSTAKGGVGIGPRGEQEFNHHTVAVGAGEGKRRDTVPVRRGNVSAL